MMELSRRGVLAWLSGLAASLALPLRRPAPVQGSARTWEVWQKARLVEGAFEIELQTPAGRPLAVPKPTLYYWKGGTFPLVAEELKEYRPGRYRCPLPANAVPAAFIVGSPPIAPAGDPCWVTVVTPTVPPETAA